MIVTFVGNFMLHSFFSFLCVCVCFTYIITLECNNITYNSSYIKFVSNLMSFFFFFLCFLFCLNFLYSHICFITFVGENFGWHVHFLMRQYIYL